jgi:predicted nucleic acid-binding protein
MGLLLDTNILSTHLKRPDLTFSKFTQHGGQLCTSQIVVAELYAWCFTFGDPHERRATVDRLLADVPPLAFDDECSWTFGELRARLGSAFAVLDLMIAATAIVREAIAVSHDADFKLMQAHVAELQVVDWLEELGR